MKKIELKSRKLLRKIFNGISLTAVAFIFQACYGMDRDCYDDVRFTGIVTSKTTNLPIKGIKVSVNDESHNIGITDAEGKFDFYAGVSTCSDEQGVSVHFLDVDGIENGSFADKTITIDAIGKDEVRINIELEEKE